MVKLHLKDRQAFQRLYEQISGRMFGLCLKLAKQQDLAEEALQDAFVQIWHHASEYHNERGAPLSWMMTIARYRTLDLSLRSASAKALTGCIEELSEVQRDSILLSYYRGFTHDELAVALSSPVGTVKSWVRRGLMALKRCLER